MPGNEQLQISSPPNMTITHENVSENTRSDFITFWYHKHVTEVNILFYEIVVDKTMRAI